MKTAMQELIDEMDIIKGQLWEEGLKDKSAMISDMIKKAVKLLEKEKQQSINLIKQTCMFMGASIIDIEISKMEFEDIYNNYYN
jgi:hypothetical protein